MSDGKVDARTSLPGGLILLFYSLPKRKRERESCLSSPIPHTNNPWERPLFENESLMLCLHCRDIIPIPTAHIYYWFILVIYLRNSFLAMPGYAEFILLK